MASQPVPTAHRSRLPAHSSVPSKNTRSSMTQAQSPFFIRPSTEQETGTEDLSEFQKRTLKRQRSGDDDDDSGGQFDTGPPTFSHSYSQSTLPPRPSTRASTRYTSRRSQATTPFLSSEGDRVLCALSEARGITPTVGVAFVNTASGEVILSQIADSQFYVRTIHKLEMLEPATILLVSSSCPPNPKSNLYNFVEEHVPGSKLMPHDRKYWSEDAGLRYIENLALREDAESVQVALQGNFFATCAFAAIVKHIEISCSLQVVPHSLRIRYEPSEDTMMIDISAIQSLELIQNLRAPRSKECLYGILNETQTPMGARLLRSNILQPSTSKESILESRYDAVSELVTSERMFSDIRHALKQFDDVERMLTKLVILPKDCSLPTLEKSLNEVINVKAFLTLIPDLFQALGPARSPLLAKIRDLCCPEATSAIMALITEQIEDDVTFMKTPLEVRNSRMFAVRAGISGLLDVARRTYKEVTNDVHVHLDQLNDEHSLNGLLKFDQKRGYYIQLKAVDFQARALPDVLVNQFRKKAHIECLTMPLKKLNSRLQDSSAEAILLGDKIIQGLLDSIRTLIQPMIRVCESVALLDMLSAFAQVTSMRDYIRPDLTSTLALKQGRHPILDKTMRDNLVPNDFFADDNYRFPIITGCNMSGKSTYIRTITLLQIMAQIGCFVPAEYAAFPVVHSIFARVSTNDSIEANMSTFSVEMREMAFILRNVDRKSLVIIDELGRGTSTRDGLAIAIAMAEALIQSRANVWFATHFTDLAKVLSDRHGVLNLHLATRTSTTADNLPKLTMLYKLESGRVKDEHYGITLAKAVGLPDEFTSKAEEVSRRIQIAKEAKKQSEQTRKILSRRKLILSLHSQLKKVASGRIRGEALAEHLTQLQEEFVARMDAIDQGQDGGDVSAEDDSEVGGEDGAGETGERIQERSGPGPTSAEIAKVKLEQYDDEDLDDGIDDDSLWDGSGL